LWIGPRNSCTQPSHWRYVCPTPAVVLPVGPRCSWTDCRIWCFNPYCCLSSHVHFGISTSEKPLRGILVVSSVLGIKPIAVLSCRRPLYRVPEHGACIAQKARILHDSVQRRDKGGTVTLYWAKDFGTVKSVKFKWRHYRTLTKCLDNQPHSANRLLVIWLCGVLVSDGWAAE
jgi:hypothetical protein